MFVSIGEVRDPTEGDFDSFRKLCDDPNGWSVSYNKSNIVVSVKDTSYSSFKMFKVKVNLKVDAVALYDCLHDCEYRPLWDKNLIEGYQLCKLHSNSDIGYYSMKSPLAFKNRDFVTQRCWKATDKEYLIFNHSIFHKKLPPKKEFVRGISYVTGYKLTPTGKDKSELIYVTQSNPRGYIPAWAINTAAKFVVPKVIDRFQKAAMKYTQWKASHNPDFKPWYDNSLSKAPYLDFKDILSHPDVDIEVNVEENVTQSAAAEYEDADFDLD